MVFEDRTLTYAALDAHANRLAHHLQALGVGPETVVGLCVERSPEMVIGLLGILKAGGAYLPLDPNYPRERLAFMLADAGCPVLVTQSALLDRLPDDAAHRQIVRLDADWPAIARQPDTAPPLDLDPRHPAYVIYTSGSTGTPKGVVVEHQQIAAFESLRRALIYRNRRGRSCSASVVDCFDSSVAGTFCESLSGGTLVLSSEELSVDAALSAIVHHRRELFPRVPSCTVLLIDLIQDMPHSNL